MLLIFSNQETLDVGLMETRASNLITIEFDKSESGLFEFKVSQDFPAEAPLYSELEIEVLDEHYDHMYSFYKDLWQEVHPNGEGGNAMYNDTRLEFQVVLPETKRVHIRAFTALKEPITIAVSKRIAGIIYLKLFFWIFLVVSTILLIGMMKWGTPAEMIQRFKKSKSIKHNKGLKLYTLGLLLLIIGISLLSIYYVGYPHGGGQSTTPSIFFGTDNVNYLG